MVLSDAKSLLTTLAIEPPRHTWPGSANHLVAVALCAAAIFVVIQYGRLRAYQGTETRLRLQLGVLGIVSWFVLNIWYFLPNQFTWAESLPLHICDLGNLLAGFVFLTLGRWRTTRAVLYFWAFGLTTQGFITPVVEEGPTAPRYWLFWINHSVVLGFALYDVVVGRFYPTWLDLVRAVVVTAGYAAVIFPVNLLGGWNYGYIGPDLPETQTILNALGDWPGRMFKLMGLAFASFVLVYLPWSIGRWFRRRRASREENF